MKYYNITFEELFEAYWECRKHKSHTHQARKFGMYLSYNLYKLLNAINRGTYKISPSIAFCVHRPVTREVFAASFCDRIIHHLVIRRLLPYLENYLIDDNYSCRKGKGTSYAIMRCAEKLYKCSENYTKETHIAKFDLKSFFMTIDKNRLYDALTEFINENKIFNKRDYDCYMWLMREIIFDTPQDHCIIKQDMKHWVKLSREKSLFYVEKIKGLPIGNLTSQIFANFYLHKLDIFITETLGLKYYGRYVDDFYIMSHNKQELIDAQSKIRDFLVGLGITLHPKKCYLQDMHKGVKFVGAVILPNRIYIANRTKGNFWMSLKDFHENFIEKDGNVTLNDVKKFINSTNSYLGFLKHYKTYNIRKKLLISSLCKPWLEYLTIDSNYLKVSLKKEMSTAA